MKRMNITHCFLLIICVSFGCICWGKSSWKKAKFKQFPFVVHVSGIKNGTGVIVHPSRVLTSGHIVTDICNPNETSINSVVVIGGTETISENVFSGKYSRGFQKRIAAKIHVNPNFYGGVENDLAIITLTEPFKINGNVAVANLPKRFRSMRRDYLCDFIGWATNPNNSSLTLEFIITEAHQNKPECGCILDKFLMDRVLCISPLASRLSCEKNLNGGVLFCDDKLTGLLLPYDVSCNYDIGDMMAPDVCLSAKHNQSAYNIFSKINSHEEWISRKVETINTDKGPSLHEIQLFQSILILIPLLNKL